MTAEEGDTNTMKDDVSTPANQDDPFLVSSRFSPTLTIISRLFPRSSSSADLYHDHNKSRSLIGLNAINGSMNTSGRSPNQFYRILLI